jgi:hypothetical protein
MNTRRKVMTITFTTILRVNIKVQNFSIKRIFCDRSYPIAVRDASVDSVVRLPFDKFYSELAELLRAKRSPTYIGLLANGVSYGQPTAIDKICAGLVLFAGWLDGGEEEIAIAGGDDGAATFEDFDDGARCGRG